jgi:predicted HTH domain antitoxin
VNLRGFDPAAEPMTATEALIAFLGALGVSSERMPTALDDRAALLRSLVHGKRMLLLLDNARSAEQIRPLLPGTPSCLVLVTSRNRLDDLVLREGASRVTLEVRTHEEAHDLLSRYLDQQRLDTEPESARALIEHCSGLPLALGIVAVRAAQYPDFPLDELVAELRNERERLDALDTAGETGVRAVFSWSYHSLSAPAARLFRLLGLPTGPDISLAAASDLAGLSQRETRKLLDELTRTHLLEQHAPGRYQFHDLLRAYAAECAAEDETADDRHAAIQRLLDHYLHTSDRGTRHFLTRSRSLSLDLPQSDAVGLTFDDSQSASRWWAIERANLLAAIQQASKLELREYTWKLPHTLRHFFKLRSVKNGSTRTTPG